MILSKTVGFESKLLAFVTIRSVTIRVNRANEVPIRIFLNLSPVMTKLKNIKKKVDSMIVTTL